MCGPVILVPTHQVLVLRAIALVVPVEEAPRPVLVHVHAHALGQRGAQVQALGLGGADGRRLDAVVPAARPQHRMLCRHKQVREPTKRARTTLLHWGHEDARRRCARPGNASAASRWAQTAQLLRLRWVEPAVRKERRSRQLLPRGTTRQPAAANLGGMRLTRRRPQRPTCVPEEQAVAVAVVPFTPPQGALGVALVVLTHRTAARTACKRNVRILSEAPSPGRVRKHRGADLERTRSSL